MDQKKIGQSLFWKRVWIIMLSVIMGVSLTTEGTVFPPPPKSSKVPIIMVHGMGGAPLYYTDKEGNEVLAGSVQAKEVLKLIRDYPNAVSRIFKLASKKQVRMSEWNELLDAASAFAGNADINCSPDGGPNGLYVNNYWTDPLSRHPEYFDYDNGVTRIAKELCEENGYDNVYAYNYDWRLDLYDSGAGGLNTFIHKILEQTGAEKVTLVADSLGGATVNCYLDAHKNDGVLERLIIVNGAFEGVDFASAYSRSLCLSSDEAMNYLKQLGTSLNGGKYEILFLAGSAIFSGMLNSLSENLNNGLSSNHIQNRIFLDYFHPIFGNIPAIFECIPYKDFEKSMRQMVKIGYLKSDSVLYRKLQRYHEVQKRADQNLIDVHNNGTQVAIIASYGYPGIPLTPKCQKQTDILIETEHESAGATVANSGEKLNIKNGKYKSADREIDASTCALPDNTWFIKNLRHVDFKVGTPAMKLIAGLAIGYYDCNLESVKKAEGYQQFLLADPSQNLTNITPKNTGESRKPKLHLTSTLQRAKLLS